MIDRWITLCQRLVPEILRQRDWHLVTPEELPLFVERVHRAIIDGTVKPLPGAEPEATVGRATIHLYCYELYEASGEASSLRQRRAFEEIGRYAQGVAFRFEQNPAVVQACAQRALVIAWEKRDQVKKPGSFLRWLESVVYYEIKGYWKEKQPRREVPMSQFTPPGDAEDQDLALKHFWDTLASIPPPDDEVVDDEQREELWAEVRCILANNRRYEAVIVGYYRHELSLPELAKLLDTSVRNVYVLKSRALARLRADEAFVQRFAGLLGAGRGGES